MDTSARAPPADAPVLAKCRLDREPQFEGVNFRGFSRNSGRMVDRVCEGFGKVGKADRVIRRGQLGSAGSEITLEIRSPEMTRSLARQVGELVSAVARAVE